MRVLIWLCDLAWPNLIVYLRSNHLTATESKPSTHTDWKHPDWIMVGMWWFGALFVLFVAPSWVGFIGLALIAALRTYITYGLAQVND